MARRRSKKNRKLTQERVDAINRRRDLIEGTDRSIEQPVERLVLDEGGHPLLLCEGARDEFGNVVGKPPNYRGRKVVEHVRR